MGRARAVPGVKSAALASTAPMSVENDAAEIVPEGFQFPAGKDNVTVFANRVDENYFDTMAVPLVRGQGFPGDGCCHDSARCRRKHTVRVALLALERCDR